MPKKFDDMVAGVWSSIKGKVNPKTKKPFSESDAYAMATAKWKNMHGKAPSRENVKDWRLLEFYVPIQETTSIGKDFLIKGVAINETTTRNGIKYIAQELERAAPSFRGKPILLDHKNEVKNIVGRTTENVNYNPVKKAIEFEARIMDKEIQSMINDGRIGDVSIGAKVQDLIQNKDSNEVTAMGIEGLEISLVAVPGDPGANIGQALENSFQLKERFEKDIEEEDEEEEDEDGFVDEQMMDEVEIKKMIKKQHPDLSDKEIDDMVKKKMMKQKQTEEEQMVTCPGCGMKYDMDEKKWSGEKRKEERIKKEIIFKLN